MQKLDQPVILLPAAAGQQTPMMLVLPKGTDAAGFANLGRGAAPVPLQCAAAGGAAAAAAAQGLGRGQGGGVAAGAHGLASSQGPSGTAAVSDQVARQFAT
jgi:hypothetical protein